MDDTQPDDPQQRSPRMNWLEPAAAIAGLLITLAVVGGIAWQAWSGPDETPPLLSVEARKATRFGSQSVVEITVRNASPSTAAAVRVEGKLTVPGREPETSEATFDYIPGRSKREGGLVFSGDATAGALEVRALGYVKP